MEIILAAIAVFCIFSKEKSIKTASVILIAFSVITFIPNIIIGFNRVDAAAEPQYVIHAGGRDKGEKIIWTVKSNSKGIFPRGKI